MRTTLDIDADILQTVKELAAIHGLSAGRVLSDLARSGLTPATRKTGVRNGVPLLGPRPSGAPRPTMKRVNELRDGD